MTSMRRRRQRRRRRLKRRAAAGFSVFRRRVGIPVGGDTLGSHQDKCTESRGSEIGSWSTRRVNVMDALGFRRFFALVQEKTDMDGSACPIPTSTYIDVHGSLSTLFLVLVILGVLRAPDWGIKPSDVALLQLPALVLYCAPFAMGSRFGMTRAANDRGSGNGPSGRDWMARTKRSCWLRFSFRTESFGRSCSSAAPIR